MIKEVLNRIQLSKEDILITGDRIETDIAMGNAFGIDTALVNTGIKNFPNGSIKPAYILNSINNLFDVST
jgi:ribonucleotide monophosphatase NagD (HAD superfamily)